MRIFVYLVLGFFLLNHISIAYEKGFSYFMLLFWAAVFSIVFLCERHLLQKKKRIREARAQEELRQEELRIAYIKKIDEALHKIKLLEDATTDKYKIIEFEIAGLYYRSPWVHDQARYLEEGTTLSLKLDPKNKYDENAVKVMLRGIHLGFVPEYYSEEICNDIKEKEEYIVKIIDNDRSRIPHIYIKLIPRENRTLLDYS